MNSEDRQLIEAAFPLKQASIDSVHEKYVRHGHISTMHIWPARRPLAASRAALITTLLPSPDDQEERDAILGRMGGRVVETIKQKKEDRHTVEEIKEETAGGILHWKRESAPDIQWFWQEIRKAYGGRAPKVLDPFAGGGAIPLEALRLGCKVTALDINPVAWFILKCALEYPQKLAGHSHRLPAFILEDRDVVASFLKAKGLKGSGLRTRLKQLSHINGDEVQPDLVPRDDPILKADLAWHIRAWGHWILAQARKTLAAYYPTYAEFVPLQPGGDYEVFPPRLLKVDASGIPQFDSLNAKFDDKYLADPRNPRWIAKPTVAYLWARTVECKQCRATLPLLKTCWLCKIGGKRVLLTVEPNSERTGFSFDVESAVPQGSGNSVQRKQHDKRIGAGTMSGTGVTCLCCGAIMTMEDIRLEGCADRLGAVMTAVVVNGPKGKEYRMPTEHERSIANVAEVQLQSLFADIPFGMPEDPIPKGGSGAARAFSVDGYGIDTWRKLFTNRQLLCLGTFTVILRGLAQEPSNLPECLREAVIANLALVNDRLVDRSSAICTWDQGYEKIRNTFARFALPIVWDFTEVNPLSDTSGNYLGALEWVSRVAGHTLEAAQSAEVPAVQLGSATGVAGQYDAIVTDPPYYDAIPYSDLMDFFHIWLRRATYGLSPEIDAAFREPLGPKWDRDSNDGELIDDASRFGGDKKRSKKNYEDGMTRVFQACQGALRPDGRLVVVFANKQPDAWETLVAALIKAGFVVVGSWPIQTEMGTRMRAKASAALASSVWLVCRKRPAGRPGWDSTVLQEMQENIVLKLREFWDAGIRGPDFVWAATGPALEAFSRYPAVKKANAPNQLMSISEFLREVRRMVVDFVVGRVLTREGQETASGLDDVTTYYLLHRHDYGMAKAPVGGCILYALSCNLSDAALARQYDLLAYSSHAVTDAEDSEDDLEAKTGQTSGAQVRLKAWNRRTGRNLGVETPGGRPVPLVDQVHKLMHLWKAGDQTKVNAYLDTRGLSHNRLFNQLLQALVELADSGAEERSILESLSNHIAARGEVGPSRQPALL